MRENQRTAAELAALDAGCRFERDGAFPFKGMRIGVPSLRDVLDRHREASIIIELKSPDPRLAEAVVEEIHAAGVIARVTVGPFEKGALDAVRGRWTRTSGPGPTQRMCAPASTMSGPGRSSTCSRYREVFAGTRVVTPAFIASAHDAGVTVVVWTVNQIDDMRRLLDGASTASSPIGRTSRSRSFSDAATRQAVNDVAGAMKKEGWTFNILKVPPEPAPVKRV